MSVCYFFLPNLILKYSNKKAEISVIVFAKIMEGLFIRKPYISHPAIPIKNIKSIDKDKLDTSLVFHVLYTCGRNAAVVKTAAINPIISI